MALKEKLEKIKKQQVQTSEPDWEKYKEDWKNSINSLQHTIMDRWFEEYAQDKLMEFSIVPVKLIDPYIGEYLTSYLEIALTGNKYVVLEPISAITSEYNGKLEFYMRGNIYKKVSILRNITDSGTEWIITSSYDTKDNVKLDKLQLEKLIEKWLQ